MAFASGSIVKNLVPVTGVVQAYRPELHPTDPTVNPGIGGGEEVTIPAGHTGEVMDSDDLITYVMYPIHENGPLQPHLVKVQSWTEDFQEVVRRRRPFVWQPTDYHTSAYWPGFEGWHSALLDPDEGTLNYADDDETSHEDLAHQIDPDDWGTQDSAWHGLYNPGTGQLAHMGPADFHHDEFARLFYEDAWREHAKQHGLDLRQFGFVIPTDHGMKFDPSWTDPELGRQYDQGQERRRMYRDFKRRKRKANAAH